MSEHAHGHGHSHDHHEHINLKSLNASFIIGIILNGIFVLVEFGAGFYYNSVALLSDAGHNLGDVVSLVLALLAFRLARVKANNTFTYGYRKATILVSLANAILLSIAIGSIAWESVQRFQRPEAINGSSIAYVAIVGILINSVTAFLFFRSKDHDLNVKGAFLHLAADAMVSLGVAIAGVVIVFTKWYWIDPMISLIVVIVIAYSTWNLLRESLVLSLDGVPKDLRVEGIKESILAVPGVKSIHHMHVWALSTSMNAMTAHVVLEDPKPSEKNREISSTIKHELLHMGIQHATLELENSGKDCSGQDC